ncbi:forespore capture DNA-binding protein RefZ [Pontibacillus yanchengensis]|uniref:Forespore capture DNA-binding protein RefZ n=2 Tax=Pontibacillus yanchengensis TaxID=462910 RepID=A0ACC7VG69_9BACI|nr:forespore capture DNA-binding protein RefZ [Pontibacillus yanchengensis]MYL34101.1 forespore capture DNA-binding protein RefZ [Pontibacillus yanchengensis]MYL53194.1 forespore capture DNA-binding protein RefZ [Pontibacillus yanchengensis]
MTSLNTKQKVMDAARSLFYTKGYNGTSVRDIAAKAKVNVSLISYHFKNKQGLLEYMMIHYFESYIELLESVQQEEKEHSSRELLRRMIEVIIHYKQTNYQFTCFIHRELTLDNVLVREMMVTYLAKEKYLLFGVFKRSLQTLGLKNLQINYYYIQFKGMLMTPFLMPYEMREHVSFDQSHDYFMKQYSNSIINWLEYIYNTNQKPGFKQSIM